MQELNNPRREKLKTLQEDLLQLTLEVIVFMIYLITRQYVYSFALLKTWTVMVGWSTCELTVVYKQMSIQELCKYLKVSKWENFRHHHASISKLNWLILLKISVYSMTKIIVTVHLYCWEAHKIGTETSKLDLDHLVQRVPVSFTSHGWLCTCAS